MRDPQRGSVATVVALTVPVILLGLGLAIDNGHLQKIRQGAQMAADATALAAAQELKNGNEDSLVSTAREDAALNGFEHGNGSNVAVNRPPASGLKAGDSNFVEVIVRHEAPVYFWSAISSEPVTVEARAVAGLRGGGGNCILTLDSTSSNAFYANGNAKVTGNNCSFHINSSNSSGGRSEGSARVEATTIAATGGVSGNGWDPDPQESAPLVADPFESLPSPSYGGCDHNGEYTVDGSRTLNPGVYCGGIKVTGRATFRPGTYILRGGGFIASGDADLLGDGVTFFNTEGGGYDYKKVEFTLGSGGSADLKAPTSGAYKGILFFQDPDNFDPGEATEFKNDTSLTLSGAMYFPGTEVLFTDKTKIIDQNLLVVAKKVEFNDDVEISFKLSPDNDLVPGAIQKARLVE